MLMRKQNLKFKVKKIEINPPALFKRGVRNRYITYD